MRNCLSFWCIFCFAVVTTMAAAEAAQTSTNADSSQSVLDRLTAMQPSQQQAWLKRLEKRADRAAQLAFKPEESAKQQAAIHAKLHQKTIALKTLREVIQETDDWEKNVINQLAKDYRRMVFEVFHQDLHAYADRQRAWLDLQQSWKDSGSPFEPQDRLIDWLEAAIRSVAPTRIGPIPAKPNLDVEKLPAVVAKKHDAKPQAARDAKPQAVVQSKEIAKPQAAEKPPVAKLPPMPAAEKPPVAKLPPMQAIEANVTPPERSVARVPLHRRENDPSTSDPPPVVLRRVESSLPVPPSREDFDLPKRQPHSLGKPQPVVSRDVLRELAAETHREPTVSQPTPSDAVEVQIGELTARIAGCNLAFRAMEAELDENGDWDAARLEPLMDRLKILVTRRHDLNLFRNALSESQRSSVDPLASEKSVVSQFAACIVAARQRAMSGDSNGSDAERQTELERLEKLSRRLAETTGK